jgi:hypothetical protein
MLIGIGRDQFHAKRVENFGDSQLPEIRGLPGGRFLNLLFCDQHLQRRVDVSGRKPLPDTRKLLDLFKKTLDFRIQSLRRARLIDSWPRIERTLSGAP